MKLQRCIIAILLATSLSFSPEIQAQGRTPTITTLSSSGTRTAGIRRSTWIFSSNFTGTVLGVAFTGGTDASVEIDAPSGETLAPIVYTVTAGSIRLVEVR